MRSEKAKINKLVHVILVKNYPLRPDKSVLVPLGRWGQSASM